MHFSLLVRISLCIVSGIGVGLVQIYLGDLDGFGGQLIFYGISGLLFAAGVLFPYLSRDRAAFLRAIGLVVASTASYWCAVTLAIENPVVRSNELVSFTIASIAGASIVIAALLLMTSVRLSGAFIAVALLAAIIGGPITHATLPEGELLILLGHASWHLLICFAISFGARSERADAVDSGSDVP